MVLECDGDADKTIASKAIEMAKDGKRPTVVADDTDILVMLIYMWEETMSDLFLRHEARKSIKKDVEINHKYQKLCIKTGSSHERKLVLFPCMGWL